MSSKDNFDVQYSLALLNFAKLFGNKATEIFTEIAEKPNYSDKALRDLLRRYSLNTDANCWFLTNFVNGIYWMKAAADDFRRAFECGMAEQRFLQPRRGRRSKKIKPLSFPDVRIMKL